MEEEFRDIVDYEGLYQVSNLGNVKSLARKGRLNERILKPSISSSGYLKVILCENKIQKTFQIHQLVAIMFLDHKPDGHKIVIDHIDGNKLNNNVDNIQLVSQRYNKLKDATGTSKYPGVYWCKKAKKWKAQIRYLGRQIHLGLFEREYDAGEVYSKALARIQRGLHPKINKKK